MWFALPLYLAFTVAAAGEAEEMLSLLQGEFAFQQGDYAAASSHYLDAAQFSRDPAVAERAARIALVAEQNEIAASAVARWQALAPENPALHSVRALMAVRAGDTAAATEALDRLLGEPDGWQLAVQVLAAPDHGLHGAVVLAALIGSPRMPSELDPLLAFGGLAMRHQLLGLAADTAERATSKHPLAVRAWLWRAEVERGRDAPDAARAALDAALALPALENANRLAIAAQFDALGDPQAAARVLADAEQDDATLAGRAAYLARADATELLGALYVEIRDGEHRSGARSYLLGQLAELTGDTVAALAWYDQIEPGMPRDRARLRIAVLQHQGGALDEALATLHALQESGSEHGEVLIDAYLLEAQLLREHKDRQAAVEALGRGLGVFEDEPSLLYARALLWERMDRVTEAIVDLRRLVAIDPDNPDALNALGYTLADRTGEYKEAHALIRRALQLKPDSAAILDSMGWVLHKLGRSNEGLGYLRRSFEAQPDAEVAAHLGEVLWLLGKQDEARQVWEQGSEIDAENGALLGALERFGT
jgi:tetratricopeptide (TPR) repeat protein